MKKIIKLLKDNRGEGYIDVVVTVVVIMMLVAFSIRLFPVFITKIQLDNFADELVREAEVSGYVGSATTDRYNRLSEKTGIAPSVTWSTTGKIQLNHEVTVTLSLDKNIGLFGEFGSFPIRLKSSATGKSEVYWK